MQLVLFIFQSTKGAVKPFLFLLPDLMWGTPLPTLLMTRMLGSAQPAMSHLGWITLSLTLRRRHKLCLFHSPSPLLSDPLNPRWQWACGPEKAGEKVFCRERCILSMIMYEMKYEDTSSDHVLKAGRWCHWLIDVTHHLCWMICLGLCGLLRLNSSWVFDKLMRNKKTCCLDYRRNHTLNFSGPVPPGTWDFRV